MKPLLAFALVAAPLGAAHAQSMQVATFLAKAESLQKKGPLALLSGDLKLLKAEIGGAAKQLRSEQNEAQRAGRKPATCLPEKASMNSDEVISYFRAIPPAQRTITVKAAFAGLMRKKYPCPA